MGVASIEWLPRPLYRGQCCFQTHYKNSSKKSEFFKNSICIFSYEDRSFKKICKTIFFQFHSPSMGVALSISRDWNHISFSLLSEWYLIAHQKHLRAQQKQPDSPPEIFLKGCQLISVELTDFSRMPPRNLTVLVPLTYLKKLQWPGIELGPTDQDLSAIPSELSWLLDIACVK